MADETAKNGTEELTKEEEREREEVIERLLRLNGLQRNLEQAYMKLHTNLKPLNQAITDMKRDLDERHGDEAWKDVRDNYYAYHAMLNLITEKLSEAKEEIDDTREEMGFELVRVKDLLGIDSLGYNTAQDEI